MVRPESQRARASRVLQLLLGGAGVPETEQRGAEVTRANCDDRVVFSRRHDGERDGAEVESSRAVQLPRGFHQEAEVVEHASRDVQDASPTEELRGFVRDLRI